MRADLGRSPLGVGRASNWVFLDRPIATPTFSLFFFFGESGLNRIGALDLFGDTVASSLDSYTIYTNVTRENFI